MIEMRNRRKAATWTASFLLVALLAGCTTAGTPRREREPYVTKRDRTVKGASVGAVVGAAGAVLAGKREADEILAGAAIGGAIGAGVGAYMDAQQEKIARIPGTTVERVDENTLLVHFENDVLFAVNSSALDSDGRATLDDVAQVLNEYAKTAVVGKHPLSDFVSAEPDANKFVAIENEILAALQAFVQAVRTGTAPPVTGLDGCLAVEAADACYRSAARHGAVMRCEPAFAIQLPRR